MPKLRYKASRERSDSFALESDRNLALFKELLRHYNDDR